MALPAVALAAAEHLIVGVKQFAEKPFHGVYYVISTSHQLFSHRGTVCQLTAFLWHHSCLRRSHGTELVCQQSLLNHDSSPARMCAVSTQSENVSARHVCAFSCLYLIREA